MGFVRRESDFQPLPRQLALIPVALVVVLIAFPFIAHRQAQAAIPPPPASQFFDGLPVAGNAQDAVKAGFRACVDFKTRVRCLRRGLTLFNQGPFSAAIDLAESGGRGGFNQLTLWNDRDQDAPIDIGRELERQNWESCRTARGNYGDQHIFMRPGSPVRISIDISYYGKRRIRIIPEWQAEKPVCQGPAEAA